jgi:hypothetical protein
MARRFVRGELSRQNDSVHDRTNTCEQAQSLLISNLGRVRTGGRLAIDLRGIARELCHVDRVPTRYAVHAGADAPFDNNDQTGRAGCAIRNLQPARYSRLACPGRVLSFESNFEERQAPNRKCSQQSSAGRFNGSAEPQHHQTAHPPAVLQVLAIVAAGLRHVGRDRPCEQLRLLTGR